MSDERPELGEKSNREGGEGNPDLKMELFESLLFVGVLGEMDGECCCGREEGHMGWIGCALEEAKRRVVDHDLHEEPSND